MLLHYQHCTAHPAHLPNTLTHSRYIIVDYFILLFSALAASNRLIKAYKIHHHHRDTLCANGQLEADILLHIYQIMDSLYSDIYRLATTVESVLTFYRSMLCECNYGVLTVLVVNN